MTNDQRFFDFQFALTVSLILSLAILAGAAAGARPIAAYPGNGPDQVGTPYIAASQCAALPAAAGRIVQVDTEAELWNAVNEGVPNTTILVADGSYNLGQNGHYLWFDTPNVTLRSASGNREAVILDDNYSATEIVSVVASNVTIADITIKRAGTHPIHVTSSDEGHTLNTLIYNVHIIDPGQQAIKINAHSAKTYFADDGEIACSHIELTDAGRPKVWEINGSCYTGGVDGHWARNWVIRDNLIEGFWCPQGLSEHAVHFWTGSRDTLVERNTLSDNARGVGFGLLESGSNARTYSDNPCPGVSGYVDHYGGLVRNNFIFAARSELFASEASFDSGIALWQACQARVVHNSVVSTQPPATANQGSIEWRFSNTSVELVNNLVSHNLVARNGASATQAGNLTQQPLSLFVDGDGGDLHLAATASAAVDHGSTLAAGVCDDDYDGDERPAGAARDVGADEYNTPAPTPPDRVNDLLVVTAGGGSGNVPFTLRWTAPARAVTYTVRYHTSRITAGTWPSAAIILAPPSPSSPGQTEWFTPSISYSGGTVYFALKSQNAAGDWSDVSNNAFWPPRRAYLPFIVRDK